MQKRSFFKFKKTGKNSEEVNDMVAILKEAKFDNPTLNELRKKRDSTRKTQAELSEEHRNILAGIEAKTELLNSLRTECVVTERRIKDYQNDIFLLEKKSRSSSRENLNELALESVLCVLLITGARLSSK